MWNFQCPKCRVLNKYQIKQRQEDICIVFTCPGCFTVWRLHETGENFNDLVINALDSFKKETT